MVALESDRMAAFQYAIRFDFYFEYKNDKALISSKEYNSVFFTTEGFSRPKNIVSSFIDDSPLSISMLSILCCDARFLVV